MTATGFNASKMLWPMEIIGKDGKLITEYWEHDNPRANLELLYLIFLIFLLCTVQTRISHMGVV